MKGNVSSQGIRTLIEGVAQKEAYLATLQDTSFQERKLISLMTSRKSLLEFYAWLFEHQVLKTKIFNVMLEKHHQNQGSLLGLCHANRELLTQQQACLISHKHTSSQGLLLSIYLAKELGGRVDLVTCDRLLRGVGHLIAEETEADRIGFAREAAGKEGVDLHDLASWQPHPWLGSGSVVVLDLFGLSPLEYRPFLLAHHARLAQAKGCFLYHSHLQDQELAAQLEGLPALAEALSLQLWPEHPLETLVERDEAALLERLAAFLKEDSERPEKQDAVVFVPADVPPRRFAARFGEQLSKLHLRELVNVVAKPHQQQSRSRSNVFLVSSAGQLAEWDYDYSALFYAVDFESEAGFRFDYQLGSYVQHVAPCSGAERARRMAAVGSTRIGRYACLSAGVAPNPHYAEAAPELSTYLLRMAAGGLSGRLERDSPRVEACLGLMERLGIVKRVGETIKVADQRVLEAVQEGVNPLEAKLVLDILSDQSLKEGERQRRSYLMSIVMGLLWSGLNLHKETVGSQMIFRNKSDSIWKRSGYLESCLQIFAKCDSIEIKSAAESNKTSEVEIIKRLSSRVSEDENNVFGCLFSLCEEAPANAKEGDVPTYLKFNEVNEDVYYELRSKIDHIREVLGITPLNIILEKEDLQGVFRQLIATMPQAIVYYSGLKRIGYKFQTTPNTAKLSQETLLAKTGEHPEYLYVMGLSLRKNCFEIEFSNTFSEEDLMECLGRLPMRKMESHGEVEVQFHGISTAGFEELLQNQHCILDKFEEENDCSLDLKQEMAMVVLHCSRPRADKIKKGFESLLQKIRERINCQKKLIHYLGKTSLVMGTGGVVQDIFREQYIDKCLLSNIDEEVSKDDLEELFEEFFLLKQIVMNPPEQNNSFRSATIYFYSQKDYYRFYQYYNGCLYCERELEVRPIKDPHKDEQIKANQYIDFQWSVWQSCCKALVQFDSQAGADKTAEAFRTNPKLDDVEVMVKVEGREVTFENLRNCTDELYIREAVKAYGEVVSVELLKYPLREETNPDNYLENLVRKVGNNEFKLGKVLRHLNGMRSCKVTFPLEGRFLMQVVNKYHQKVGILGEGRLHAFPHFEKPVLIPTGLRPLYIDILDECIHENHVEKTISHSLAKQNGLEYVVLQGTEEVPVQNFYRCYLDRLKPQKVTLAKKEREMVFNDLALSSILFLEQRYSCKLVIDLVLKEISFVACRSIQNKLKEEVKSRLLKGFYYLLRLNSKTYHHLTSKPAVLEQIKKEFILMNIALELDSYAVMLSGSIENVEKATTYLMHIAESLQAVSEPMNPDVCGICCQRFKRPYRMQKCSHMFCSSCLQDYYKMMLKDVTLFPAKCPQCSELIVLRDLQANLTKPEWEKLKSLGLNRYVNLSGDKLRFCYTAGCKQLNFVQGPTWRCDTCKVEYCNLCKEPVHFGILCGDVMVVRQSDEYFKKYMVETGGRFCPGCAMPVVRLGGCYRVTCTRCDKSMCFRCQPDKMIAYDTDSECYEHLDEVHGGYF